MGSGLISIAVSGINAANMGLMVTGNNIANSSTPGYTLQRVVQTSNPTVMSGAGGLGEGVNVQTVERMYSQALTTQVLNAQTNVSSLDTNYSLVSQIDNMLADPTAGLTPVVQEFFNGIQAVSANPSSSATRQSMVTSAQSMVSSFQSIYSRLDELNAGVNSQITGVVQSINSYSTDIADLNKQIINTGAINGQPANDLYDKRDQLVSELNKLVKVNVSTDGNGSYNVFIGTGQQLVVGGIATQMSAISSAKDQSRIVVGLNGASGKVQELPESLITGGKLGGLMDFRTQSLDSAYNQIGLMAASVAQTFNAQNALGQDQLGHTASASGTSFISDFFTISDPVVTSNTRNASSSPTVSATFDTPPPFNGTNFYTNLTASDYQLSSDGTNLKLTRLSDNTSWSGATVNNINIALSANAQGINTEGFKLSDSGASYAAGDSYLIRPTRFEARQFSVNSSVAADPRLIAAASPLRGVATSTNVGAGKISNVVAGQGYANIGPLSIATDGSGNLVVSGSGIPADATVTVTAGGKTLWPVPTVPPAAPASPSPLTTPFPYTSGATITISQPGSPPTTPASPYELSFSISGTLGKNATTGTFDSFTVGSNAAGVEDASNMVRLGNLQTQNTMLGGTSSYQSSYAGFVNTIGNTTASINTASSAQTTLLSQATTARDSVSGVNLDEEAAKLIQYQQAYQAAAKALEIASKLFDTLLNL